MLCSTQACAVSVATLAVFVASLLKHLGEFNPLPPKTPNCQLLGADDIVGSEDLAAWRGGLFIVGSGDLFRTFGDVPRESPSQGALWMVDITGSNPAYRQLEWEGYPADKYFHAHGIHFSNTTGRLLVINHAGPGSAGQTQIEVFDVLGTSFQDVKLRYVVSVQTPELAPLGRLNDVVGVTKNEFYATRWRHHPVPASLGNAETTVQDKLVFARDDGLLAILEHLWLRPLGLNTPLPIYRCTFSDTDANDQTCVVAGHHPINGNGITISDDLSTVVVSCPPCKTLMFYERDARTGELRSYDELELTSLSDNVEWESDPSDSDRTATLLTGAITRPSEVDPAGDYRRDGKQCAGAVMTLRLERNTSSGRWRATRDSSGAPLIRYPVVHDGSELSQLSSGNRYGSTYIAGSPCSRGVLICHGVSESDA